MVIKLSVRPLVRPSIYLSIVKLAQAVPLGRVSHCQLFFLELDQLGDQVRNSFLRKKILK